MTNDQRDDLQDRLMDLALRRKLGAEQPCDLSEKIGSVESLRPTPLMSRTWFRLVIAASVMVAVGVAVGQQLSETTIVTYLSDSTASMESRSLEELYSSRTSSANSGVELRESEIAWLEAQEGKLRELIKNETVSRQTQHGVHISAGPAGGIDVNASGVLTLEAEAARHFADGPQGVRYPYNTSRGPRESFREGEHSGYIDNGISVGLQGRRRDRQTVDLDGDGFTDNVESRFAIDMEEQGRDRFARLNDNRFLAATENPLSTFSIDVDTASYSAVRSRIEQQRVLPPAAAVRMEELVNYFSYSYPQPTDGAPFAVHVDVAACPWAAKHRLVRIGLKGKEIAKSDRPASNLVFLVDVSGSMQPENRLPLVKHGLLRLVGELDERDRVAIVVYAGNSGCVLASTPCTQANKERIRSAITSLESGGSTNGEAGIQLAYQIAQDHFVKGGANRVILCTDGDFNVGTTGDEALKQLVADRAKSGVFLTALGFGMGNHNDQMLEAIADNGNGTYGYIDDQREVEKLFVRDLSGTLVTIAKDVKIQVEFNPAQVGAYRLIGYENRILAKEDFNNDKKDAGDIGAGHTVTALYEIVPPAALAEASRANAAASEGLNGDTTGKGAGNVDALEFQRPKQELELTEAAKNSGDMLLVKLRYKAPDGDTSTLIKTPAKDNGATFAAASSDFKFAASVAAFGMILRQSPFRGDITLAAVEEIASANRGEDQNNQRREFIALVQQLRAMTAEEGRGARD
jgi:Ca-activated chloride channel family protein